ncbi:MAG: tRNA lysidine(34) synthetase TilS [Acidobacteriota bacterium]|nr:tRNA lysidine(34) synthetase TilS [Acidobacteriota bacterium]
MTAPTLNREHLRPGDRICAALSGGADSVAMLLLLHQANGLTRNALGVGLSAVHVHHGLRGAEADADLAFVQALCMQLEVPLHVHHASVPDRLARLRQAGHPETVEEAARALRYEYFEQLFAAGHADSVLTAHTLDDQAETVLMKLLRGAWTEGLSGIHPVVIVPHPSRLGRIIRPLLGVRHADLEDFLRSQKQTWRTDSSNTDQAFTRNRVRHHLLPILREFNPALDQTLANLAELAREDEARWQSELNRMLPHVLLPGKPVRGGGRSVSTAPGEASVAIDLERLRGFDLALRRRVVRAAARQLGARLTFDDTARILALAGFGDDPTVAARPGSRIQLAGGLVAERTARELRFSRPESVKHADPTSPITQKT